MCPTSIIIWNLKSEEVIHRIVTPYGVKYIDLSPDSSTVVAILDDDDTSVNTLVMYDLRDKPRLVYKTIIGINTR